MFKFLYVIGVMLFTAGCASYGVIENKPEKTTGASDKDNYSFHSAVNKMNASAENILVLSFSGGGTRAAAFAYGVLLELRDTIVVVDRKHSRLLDQVDIISSVSGGSFTSAYYGLHGDDTFNVFEDVFLRQDIEAYLIHNLFNPLEWINRGGRTEMAVKFYQEKLFHDATFADLQSKDGPLILINATDLGHGVRFSFIQEYFSLLCSDISSFPVARAVTASSAVPMLFDPVVVKNYSECKSDGEPALLERAVKLSAEDPQLEMATHGLESFYNNSNRQYAHLVDGGITDNLGLRAIYEFIELTGGATRYSKRYKREVPQRIIIISVNASTEPEYQMDKTNKQPSLKDTIDSIIDIQLHRYNAATLSLMGNSISRWSKELSTPEKVVKPHFIRVAFREAPTASSRKILNAIPTSFSLTDEQVDYLIEAGRSLLRNSPEFQQLINDMQ